MSDSRFRIFQERGNIYVRDGNHDYVQGEEKYVQTFRETLLQRSFLYIVQVKLKNNNGRVKESGTSSISGLAEKLDISTDGNLNEVCYVFNTQMRNDVIVGSFISFGLPNCNPYEFRYEYRNGLIDSTNNNILYVQLVYPQGRRIVGVDVSDQLAMQPTGGLLLAELDINDYPEIQTEMTDPFDVFVNDYESIEQYYNIF